MKKGIHPNYVDTVIKCACGTEIPTKSTVPGISVEVCSNCHPFYTGKQKLMDTAGRVEKFNKKYNVGKQKAKEKEEQKAKAKAAQEKKKAETKAKKTKEKAPKADAKAKTTKPKKEEAKAE